MGVVDIPTVKKNKGGEEVDQKLLYIELCNSLILLAVSSTIALDVSCNSTKGISECFLVCMRECVLDPESVSDCSLLESSRLQNIRGSQCILDNCVIFVLVPSACCCL